MTLIPPPANGTTAYSPGIGGITAVAVDRDRNSPKAVRWAIRHLLPPNSPLVLINVVIPNSQNMVQGLASGSMEEKDGSTTVDIFSPYRLYCARQGVVVKEVTIEDTDVSKALLHYISNNAVINIALGASTRASFSRKFRNHDVPTIINKYSPDTCAVYVIGKGKLISVRPALMCPVTRAASFSKRTLSSEFQGSSRLRGIVRECDSQWIFLSNRLREIIRECDNDWTNSPTKMISNFSKHLNNDNSFSKPPMERNASLNISTEAENLMAKCNAEIEKDDSLPETTTKNHKDLEEMRRLIMELKKTKKKIDSACKEAASANKKAQELDLWQKESVFMFEQARISEEAALVVVEGEKAKAKTAAEFAEKAQKLADFETQRRKYMELKVIREIKEKNRALDVLSNKDIRYRIYSLQDIDLATGSFAVSSMIGEGGYGPVYKGNIDHTPVAVKVLRPDAKQGRKQFQQEVEILSCMRHPNLVLLLGACPEYGCLVYEFMDYGSLEDRLIRKDNTPTIPWATRFKIAADIATGLLFLHQAKPKPLVHRDLKPANILLDRNFVSKIGDVGLARLVPPSVANEVTQLHMTSAAGTFCYIDPEYQQTGKLGTKSDIYSLGVMLLQIITGRPPMGLTHHVEKALQKGKMAELLDPSVLDWPVEEAIAFARLALQCAELKRKDRPDLATVILPELTRLSNLGRIDETISHSGDNQ